MTCKRSQSLPNLGQHTTFSTPGGTDSLSNPWIHGKRRLWEERAIYFHGELSAVAPTPIGFAITGPHHKQVSLGRDLFPFFSEIQVGISLINHLLNTMLFEKNRVSNLFHQHSTYPLASGRPIHTLIANEFGILFVFGYVVWLGESIFCSKWIDWWLFWLIWLWDILVKGQEIVIHT